MGSNEDRGFGETQPRSSKEIVPEFKDGSEALAWMERRLGGWSRKIDEAKKEFEEPYIAPDLDDDKSVNDAFDKLMGF